MERIIKISLAVVALGAIAFFCYSLIAGWYKGNIETAKTQERKVWQQKTETLVEKIENLEEEITELKGKIIPSEKLAEIFGEDTLPVPEDENNISFSEIERQIAAFFAYLDDKEYVQAYKLNGGTYNQYELSVNKLSKKPPIVSGETDSLYNLFLNIAHFYRVLGKKRVFLIREILKNESEIIESVMRTFYLWYTFENDTEEKIKGRPSLSVLYDYAGYLLNTLGGRSYMLRRDSKIRILSTYYCVLILDIANDKGLNSNGIDIRPHIELTFNDISNQIGLVHQKAYLIELENLKRKYKIS
jgi:NADH:ubiquinone oxidoreductase subunit C